MTPTEQGRFCGSCQKTVVDFSGMTDKEVFDYINKSSQHACGRFSNNQLNKYLKPATTKKRFTWAYVWNIILATCMITEGNAQTKPVKKKKPSVYHHELKPSVGHIHILEPDKIKPDSNYKAKTQEIANKISNPKTNTEITMELVGILGGYSVGVKVSRKEKIQRVVNDWKPAILKKDIKIYPNPVVRGNNVQASLSLKQAAEYKLELLNVQGEVMTVQKLVMATKEQAITIPTQSNWAPGVYWVRISGPDGKNVYQCKVSIQ
jgi:hypothetical protein